MDAAIPKPIIRKPIQDKPLIKIDKQPIPPPLPPVQEKTEEIDFKKNLEKTTTVDPSDAPKQIQEKITIDFMNEENIKSEVKQPTQESQSPINPTIQQAQQNILAAENSAEQWSFEDYKMMASFLIELFDTGLTLACRFIAKDTTDTPYQVKNEKKEMLIKSLTHILIKYQKRAKIEFLFIATLILVYAAPFRKAFEMRKEKKKLEAQRKPEMKVIKKEEENKKEEPLYPLRRKRGGQPK